ncbi:integrase arm-type DNA-binding domain-containing protein [Breoghania sp. JC706]|uniref:tyrosine-type recombinase/integrase n=1 Tax=Breoghania sp. JC706 TaxID=3117732 RepID=UPI003009ACAB
MALSDRACKAAAAGEKIKKLSDGGGLQLWIMPNGSKLWRLAYRMDGKQKLFAIGPYPAVSLAQARSARDDAKQSIRDGIDPISARRQAAIPTPTAPTFGAVAAELIEKHRREGRKASTLERKEWLLRVANGALKDRELASITAGEILEVCRKEEAKGHFETASRLRSLIGEVFRYAIASQIVETDPTQALRGALTAPKEKHFAAATTWKDFAGVIRAVDGYEGQPGTRVALLLMAYLFPRPGEIRAARWSEFDLDRATWTIPAERMKMGREHKRHLARPALDLLEELLEISSGAGLVFPGLRSPTRPMSENTLNAALRRLGFTKAEMTSHGFRSTASSLINEDGQ